MKAINFISILVFCLLASCNSKPSLQEYFVKNSENKNFIQVDVSSSVLNIDENKLSVAEAGAIQSFKKMNILAFKLDANNKAQFEAEKLQAKEILKDKKYQQLMKFNADNQSVSVSFIGTDDQISEIILYGCNNTSGFGIARILGKNMNPNDLMTIIKVLEKSKINMDQFKPLFNNLKD